MSKAKSAARFVVRLGHAAGDGPVGRLTLLVAVATALAMALPPVRLLLPDASAAKGAGWVVSLSQSMNVDAGGHVIPAGRTWSVGFHVSQADDAPGGVVRAKIVLDSVRAASILHDARQPIDTRKLPGATLDASWQRTDGAASYGGAPQVDFGEMLGGAFPLSLLVDNVFPPMPASEVEARRSWERTWKRRSINGNSAVEEDVTARFTLERIERHRDGDVARIRVSTADDGVTGFVRIGVSDGIVREAELVETASGELSLVGNTYPYTQQTTIRVSPAGAGTGRQVESESMP